jgi:F0F1-type ATP synthase alpha subunit
MSYHSDLNKIKEKVINLMIENESKKKASIVRSIVAKVLENGKLKENQQKIINSLNESGMIRLSQKQLEIVSEIRKSDQFSAKEKKCLDTIIKIKRLEEN